MARISAKTWRQGVWTSGTTQRKPVTVSIATTSRRRRAPRDIITQVGTNTQQPQCGMDNPPLPTMDYDDDSDQMACARDPPDDQIEAQVVNETNAAGIRVAMRRKTTQTLENSVGTLNEFSMISNWFQRLPLQMWRDRGHSFWMPHFVWKAMVVCGRRVHYVELIIPHSVVKIALHISLCVKLAAYRHTTRSHCTGYR